MSREAIKVRFCDSKTCPFYFAEVGSSRNDRCDPPCADDSFYLDESRRENGFPLKCPLRVGPVVVEMGDGDGPR